MRDYRIGDTLGKNKIVSILLKNSNIKIVRMLSPVITPFLTLFIKRLGVPRSAGITDLIRWISGSYRGQIFTFQKLLAANPNFFLEMGASWGLWALSLEDLTGASGICVDIDTKDYALYRKVSKSIETKIQYMNVDIFTLDFPADSFDLIYSTEFLDHIHSPSLLIKRVHTWLKPRGTFIFQVPFHFEESINKPVVKTGHKYDFLRNGFCETTFESINKDTFNFKYYRVGKRDHKSNPCIVCNKNKRHKHPLKLVGVARKNLENHKS